MICRTKSTSASGTWLIVVLLIGSAHCFGVGGSKGSVIVDFSPATFTAKADAKFFYSIDNELKYSDQIDPEAPTLARGEIRNFQVSPDGKKLAAVLHGTLFIFDEDSAFSEVAKVDSIYRRHKPAGKHFFRDDNFQWSRDSKSLYLMGDEFFASSGSQLYSGYGELWRYEIESGELHLVLKPFRGFSYFFGQDNGLYFSEPTMQGQLQLKYFNGRISTNVGGPNESEILPGNELPFYSFSTVDYEKALPHLKVLLADGELVINNKRYLSVTQGKGWDGYYYCMDGLRSVFLPGRKFFFLNTPYCDNYSGQLLIELDSARYQTLPRNTRVFGTLNTDTYSEYRITSGGIELRH